MRIKEVKSCCVVICAEVSAAMPAWIKQNKRGKTVSD